MIDNTVEFFGKNAKWTCFPKGQEVLYVRKECKINDSVLSAELTVCGLGMFEAFINANRVDDSFFKPLFSDYEERDFSKYGYPLFEKTKHRLYVEKYDVTQYIKQGKNALMILLSNGWYAQSNRNAEGNVIFSDSKRLCFLLKITTKDSKIIEVYSDENLRFAPSHILKTNMYKGEVIDYKKYNLKAYLGGFDDSKWQNASVCKPIKDAPLCYSNCKKDKIVEELEPKLIYKRGNYALFDAGKNISGWVKVCGKGNIKVYYSEDIKNNKLEFDSTGGIGQKQNDVYLNMLGDVELHPFFRWNGFRYFTVRGKYTSLKVEVLHPDFVETATFSTDNEVLNKLFDAYKLTQLNNIHMGIPSDCPHREKLGYTGDGQLTAESVMLCYDSDDFYKKWMQDIRDCQDEKSGHVQHTAPFMGGGGGPLGWGGAIIYVPYKCYLVSGDSSFITDNFDNMTKWLDFIINETFGKDRQYGLIVKEREKGWCLGDWCTLGKIKIPEAFVNTALFVEVLRCFDFMAKAIGRDNNYRKFEDICTNAIKENYLDLGKGYCGGVQGANFIAGDIGLLEYKDLEPEINELSNLLRFNTGIIGTPMLLNVLYKYNKIDLISKLLASKNLGTFGYMFDYGSTTLWEYWENKKSHDHPMFGSVIKYLFVAIGGIRYGVGFKNIDVYPYLASNLNRLDITLNKNGVYIEVHYHREGSKTKFRIKYSGVSNVNVYVNDGVFKLESGKEFLGDIDE